MLEWSNPYCGLPPAMFFPKFRRFKPKVTRAEKLLCARLKEKGIPFTSQAKITTKSGHRYLVDILINPKIIIEVGYVGLTDIQEDEDLRESGYIVLRFKSKEVISNTKHVIEKIKKAIEKPNRFQKKP